MYKRTLFLVLIAALTFAVFSPTIAQDDAETIVDGLVNPRNLWFDSDGNLYVAESGNAGEMLTANDDAIGASGQITVVSDDGEAEVLLRGFLSSPAGGARGPQAVQATEDSYWVLLGEIADADFPLAAALVEIDREHNRVKTFVDLLTIELEQDPDGNPNGESNPVDFAVAPDGTVYIANAGCNCLMSWTAEDGVAIAASWPFEGDNPVPTSVEIDAEGNIYVGFLTGFPFPEGGARVEVWSGGELVQTYEGLTAVTGLLVADDGTIYAVETGLQGPGRVVEVTEDGPVAVLENLQAPYGIAQSPDGTIAVTVGSRGGEGGAVIALPMMEG